MTSSEKKSAVSACLNLATAAEFRTRWPEIRVIVFDAVGTLIYPDPPVAQVYRDTIAAHCQIDLTEEYIRCVLANALRDRSKGRDFQTSESAEYRFWRDLIHSFCNASPGQDACFEALYQHFRQPDHWCCFDDVRPCLQQITSHDLTIAVGSNFDQRLHDILDGHADLAPVSHRFISSEVGWRKPGPEFFRQVGTTFRCEPQQILLVGDDPRNDIQGGSDAGWPTAWICRGNDTATSIPAGTARLFRLYDLPLLLWEQVQ